jgi:hypothetical protein
MKMSVRSSEPHVDVWVYLTEAEAKELAQALTVCVLDPA